MKISSIINVLAILLMGHLFFSLFGRIVNTSYFLGFNLIRLPFIRIALYGLFFLKTPKIYFSTAMKMVYAFYIIYFLMKASGYYDTGSQWFMLYHFPVFSAILIHNYYVESKDYRGYAKVIMSAMIFIVCSALLNIYQLNRYPDAVRGVWGQLAAQGYSELSLFYSSIGIASYDFISAIPFSIPILIAYYRAQKKQHIQAIIVFVIIVIAYSTYLSSVTAPLVLAVLGIMFSLVGKRRFKASLYSVIMLTVLIIIIPPMIKANIFYSISEIVPQRDLSMKMHDIGLAFETGVDTSAPETSIESRAERIPLIFKAFLSNPILGMGHEINAHIFWLNLLAQFGIIGAFPLILIIYYHLKKCIRIYDDNYRFYFLIAILLFVALGFMKAFTGSMMYYILMLYPGMYYLRYLKISDLQEISE